MMRPSPRVTVPAQKIRESSGTLVNVPPLPESGWKTCAGVGCFQASHARTSPVLRRVAWTAVSGHGMSGPHCPTTSGFPDDAAAVVNDQVKGATMVFPARSFSPDTVAVYAVDAARTEVGVNVATLLA